MRSLFAFFFTLFSTISIASESSGHLLQYAGEVEEGNEKLIYTVRLGVPHGRTVWKDTFPATGSSPLRILLNAESSCPTSPYVSVVVRLADTHKWQQTSLKNGFDFYNGGRIDGIQLHLNQPWYSKISCTFNVYATEGEEPAPANETLVGALGYNGGFEKELAIDITPPTTVKKVRIQVPTFCKQTEVLEVFTVTEGVMDKATLLDKSQNLYSINQGAGSRITKILATLNGPAGSTCELPVYVSGN